MGFEHELWAAAEVLRNTTEPAEYKHIILGLIFLKYLSDACSAGHLGLALPDWARWSHIQQRAQFATIGRDLDAAMAAVEHANPSLSGALPMIYATQGLDQDHLSRLIEVISGIGLGGTEHHSKDTLGRVYEYFLSRFASAEGRGGGEFYTPTTVVRLLVEMLQPFRGRVYDPCCGSGGMFVQSLRFIEAHNGQRDAVTIYGQESNHATWRIARMNLAIRGIEGQLGPRPADTFKHDLHRELRADFILANPPFNVSSWHRSADDTRWQFGVPPASNANFAWIQHIVHHLAPTGTAGLILANGSMSSMPSGEGAIRRNLVEAGLVQCIVALPGQLFYSTQIPICLWILARRRPGRHVRVLFIDGCALGRMETRTHRVLDRADIARIADTYHAWRDGAPRYSDALGFCRAARIAEIAEHDFVLTPGRYVGADEAAGDDEPFADKIVRLQSELGQLFEQSQRLDRIIASDLEALVAEAGGQTTDP
ncbi:MAG: class I SAM-dependent DNA methyltransferase [Myxococcota bacterium]